MKKLLLAVYFFLVLAIITMLIFFFEYKDLIISMMLFKWVLCGYIRIKAKKKEIKLEWNHYKRQISRTRLNRRASVILVYKTIKKAYKTAIKKGESSCNIYIDETEIDSLETAEILFNFKHKDNQPTDFIFNVYLTDETCTK